ncbi:hypothetical protein BDQ17DRAFT_185335 [Cyathus striatus]|nr:hypothetical protein BDQ17DRAFT_185335 [Cyathus striatus]
MSNSSPRPKWSQRMNSAMRRTSTLLAISRPSTPSVHSVERDSLSDSGSIRKQQVDTTPAATSQQPEHYAPSPIAESPAREAAALQENAQQTRPSPLTQAPVGHSPEPMAPENTVVSPVGFTPPPLLDSTVGNPGAFTDEPEELPQPQVVRDPYAPKTDRESLKSKSREQLVAPVVEEPQEEEEEVQARDGNRKVVAIPSVPEPVVRPLTPEPEVAARSRTPEPVPRALTPEPVAARSRTPEQAPRALTPEPVVARPRTPEPAPRALTPEPVVARSRTPEPTLRVLTPEPAAARTRTPEPAPRVLTPEPAATRAKEPPAPAVLVARPVTPEPAVHRPQTPEFEASRSATPEQVPRTPEREVRTPEPESSWIPHTPDYEPPAGAPAVSYFDKPVAESIRSVDTYEPHSPEFIKAVEENTKRISREAEAEPQHHDSPALEYVPMPVPAPAPAQEEHRGPFQASMPEPTQQQPAGPSAPPPQSEPVAAPIYTVPSYLNYQGHDIWGGAVHKPISTAVVEESRNGPAAPTMPLPGDGHSRRSRSSTVRSGPLEDPFADPVPAINVSDSGAVHILPHPGPSEQRQPPPSESHEEAHGAIIMPLPPIHEVIPIILRIRVSLKAGDL